MNAVLQVLTPPEGAKAPACWRTWGVATASGSDDMSKRTCTVIEHSVPCTRPHRALGYCTKHYYRWQQHGDPLVTLQIKGDDEARFWSHVDRGGDEECWLWTGCTSEEGYGRFQVGGRDGKLMFAHRWAYEHFIGPISEGHQIDHVKGNGCQNTHCVNYLRHLEPVTNRENTLRGSGTKLSDDDVRVIFARYQEKPRLRALAREIGVHHMTLSRRFDRLGLTLGGTS